MAKKTLQNLLDKEALLNYAELKTLFLRVAAVINSRPSRVSNEGVWLPIAPNDLLHGRASGLEERYLFQADKEMDVENKSKLVDIHIMPMSKSN